MLATFLLNAQAKIYPGGKMAFGSTSSSPNYQIDVKAGDVNVDSVKRGYRINGKYVLWQNNKSDCIFVGPEAGNSNTAKHNSAFGYQALYTVTSSTSTPNNAFGYKALKSTTSGYLNDAFGDSALHANTSGIGNSAFGAYALTLNTSGNNNTAFGGKAMMANTSNGASTAVGYAALNKSTGQYNSGVGYQALLNTTSGTGNTAIGTQAGINVTTSSNNTLIGYSANISSGSTYSNSTALGYLSLATASNYMAIGNTSIQTIAGQVSFSTYSDQRVKKNIQENVPGLSFIKKLRPVTYKYDVKKENQIMGVQVDSVGAPATYPVEAITFSGLIAQEVEQAAQSLNYDFSGVDKPQNSNCLYGLRYSEFIPSIIKALQEVCDTVASLRQQLSACCSVGQRSINSEDKKNTSQSGSENLVPGAKLWQNIPNPFNQVTTIKCHIPEQSRAASLLIFDLTGALKKTMPINAKGETFLTINAKELIAGMYHYSLIIDGQEIDTKKMILTE